MPLIRPVRIAALALFVLFALLYMILDSQRATAERALFPTPQKLEWQKGEFRLRAGEPVASADPAAVSDFLGRLSIRTGADHPLGTPARLHFDLLPAVDPVLGDEGYRLQIDGDAVTAQANKAAGLFYASQTLIQLLSDDGKSFPAVKIEDWPAMKYRGVMVDISRGLVPNVATFERILRSLARLKINAVQPYIEDTFAFKAFPFIGRDRGAWTPEEVQQLSAVARRSYVDMSPCFESLGHMGQILRHPEMASLRETGDVINPANEGSYQFLKTCFEELAQAFPFPYINVGCDETSGLGQGPSKSIAAAKGVGKVYTDHVRRLDDLCHGVNRKMQIWGDMLLNYPGIAGDLPKDVIVLNWNYWTQSGFSSIAQYRGLGYEQIVCPGTQSWGCMFPDLAIAEGNIRGFAREGKAAGALGVMNTAWRDNGEVFYDYDWLPYAMGAEASWSSAPAQGEAFDRNFERAFFGPGGEGLASAFRALGDSVSLGGGHGADWTFHLYYDDPFAGLSLPSSSSGNAKLDRLAALADRIDTAVRAAHPTEHLEVLPYLSYGAARIRCIGERYRAALKAAELYTGAFGTGDGPVPDARSRIVQAQEQVHGIRAQAEALRDRYAELWRIENKEPGLKNVLDRYAGVIHACQDREARLRDALADLDAGRPLASPEKIGLALPASTDQGYRIPDRMTGTKAWAAGSVLALRVDLPRALEASVPERLVVPASQVPGVPQVARLRILSETGQVLATQAAQVDDIGGDRRLVTFFLPAGSAGVQRLGLDTATADVKPEDAVTVENARELPGGLWIGNSRFRALLGTEGAHLYRWDVTALKQRDVTVPGDTDWHGFDDVGGERASTFKLTPVLHGPLCVQLRCEAPDGFTKLLTFYSGVGWWETRFDSPIDFFWHYDDPLVMGTRSTAPGRYRFSDGREGPLTDESEVSQQDRAVWVAKYNPDHFVLGLIAGKDKISLRAGPGGSMGGVGIEGGGAAARLLTYADVAPTDWHAVADLSSSDMTLAQAAVSIGGVP